MQTQFDGAALKERRTNAGITQQDLAFRMGVAIETIRKWERGVQTPRDESVVKLEMIFGESNWAHEPLPL
jgi:transcriptional regulator with XRE-family HTH domain